MCQDNRFWKTYFVSVCVVKMKEHFLECTGVTVGVHVALVLSFYRFYSASFYRLILSDYLKEGSWRCSGMSSTLSLELLRALQVIFHVHKHVCAYSRKNVGVDSDLTRVRMNGRLFLQAMHRERYIGYGWHWNKAGLVWTAWRQWMFHSICATFHCTDLQIGASLGNWNMTSFKTRFLYTFSVPEEPGSPWSSMWS